MTYTVLLLHLLMLTIQVWALERLRRLAHVLASVVSARRYIVMLRIENALLITLSKHLARINVIVGQLMRFQQDSTSHVTVARTSFILDFSKKYLTKSIPNPP